MSDDQQQFILGDISDNNDVPIVQKVADLYKEFYNHRKLFPKRDQYLLGKRCEDYIVDILELVVEASGEKKANKLAPLEKASKQFDVLKILLRMAWETKMLDNKRYLSLQKKIQDIGKMLGGWIRSLR